MFIIFFTFAAIIIVITIIIKFWPDPVAKPSSIQSSQSNDTRERRTQTLEFEESLMVTGKYIFVDTETTGLPKSRYQPIEDSDNWPYILQIAWILLDENFKVISSTKHYLDYKGEIPYAATRIHHIDRLKILKHGEPTRLILKEFLKDVSLADYIVAHNIDFDIPIIRAELHRNNIPNSIDSKPTICTMVQSKDFVEAINSRGSLKYPKLEELYLKCFFGSIYAGTVENTHDAFVDVSMTAKCFQYMVEHNILDKDGRIPKVVKEKTVRKSKSALKVKQKSQSNEKNGFESFFFKKWVVVTGYFTTYPDIYTLHQELIDRGAVIQEIPDDKTDILIAGESPNDEYIEIALLNKTDGIKTSIIDQMVLNKLLK